MRKNVAVAVLAAMALAACSSRLPVKLGNEPLRLSIHSNNTSPRECTLTPSSKQFSQLKALIERYGSDWQSSPATYVPSRLVRGSNFSLNFQQGFAIANFGSSQFTRRIPEQELAFLVCEHGT